MRGNPYPRRRLDSRRNAFLAHEIQFNCCFLIRRRDYRGRSPTLPLLHGWIAPLLYEPPAPPPH